MRLFSLISHCLLGITTHCHDWTTAKSVFGDTTKILIVSLGIAAIMVHNVLLHNTLYAVGPRSLWTLPCGFGYYCVCPYSVTGWGYSDLQRRLHRSPQLGQTERRNHSNGTTTWQGADFHSLIVINALLMKKSLHDYVCQAISFHISPGE